MKNKRDIKIISVGGSIIIPPTGFDISFLKKFRDLIIKQVKQGQRFVLVIGGGAPARQYQEAAKKVDRFSQTDLDWIGIYATIFNAQFVRMMFKDLAYKDLQGDPTKRIKTNKSIIVGAGYLPGHSTDTDAVLLARAYGAKEVINLSNIEYVYDKDPRQFKNAQKIEQMNWADFRKNIVGNSWEAGKNAPFDPIASREAQKLGLKVSILQGTNLPEVAKALNGQKFKGTVIN